MESLFLFALRASFLIPLIAGIAVIVQFKHLSTLTTIVLLHSALFGLINTLHHLLITEIDSYEYFLLYTTLEFICFAIIIGLSSNNRRARVLITVCSIIFLVNLVPQLLLGASQKADSFNIAIETILITINIIYYFYLRFKQVDEQYLYQNPFFWLMTGMLVYLGFTFFFNILVNYVDNEVIKNYYHYSYIGDIVKNALFAVALLHLPRRFGSESSLQTFNAPNLDLI